MKILIIDSHKSSSNAPAQNLHWLNARKIADYLDADFIWSYPEVNNEIKSGYDVIVFVHASHYAYTDYEWVKRSPDANLFYITNEYNLGEPRTLWIASKEGRKYTVIANHPSEPSKIVMKYVSEWRQVNLNSLVYEYVERDLELPFPKCGSVYYGSYRRGRERYFKKYLNNVAVSTHQSNHKKFHNLGLTPTFVPRIDWYGRGLSDFTSSLYIEDEITHTHYNYLANRFYESLNYDCTPLFDESCINTIEKSGYDICEDFVISCASDLSKKDGVIIPEAWHYMAKQEKKNTLKQIKKIIQGE